MKDDIRNEYLQTTSQSIIYFTLSLTYVASDNIQQHHKNEYHSTDIHSAGWVTSTWMFVAYGSTDDHIGNE